MQVLVFRTNIGTEKKLRHIRPLFQGHPVVVDWSVDMEDCDYVLRIVAGSCINEGEVVYLVNSCGYLCEPLED